MPIPYRTFVFKGVKNFHCFCRALPNRFSRARELKVSNVSHFVTCQAWIVTQNVQSIAHYLPKNTLKCCQNLISALWKWIFSWNLWKYGTFHGYFCRFFKDFFYAWQLTYCLERCTRLAKSRPLRIICVSVEVQMLLRKG